MSKGVSIKQTSKGKLPGLPFLKLKDQILGKDYELSIIFATAKISAKLNGHYRGKKKPTNILSFPLSPKSGELVIHLPTAKKEAPAFGMGFKNFLGYLIIHGMLHLKGMQHSSKMERREKQFCRAFRFN
jgi:probable rRNA maturation factor